MWVWVLVILNCCCYFGQKNQSQMWCAIYHVPCQIARRIIQQSNEMTIKIHLALKSIWYRPIFHSRRFRCLKIYKWMHWLKCQHNKLSWPQEQNGELKGKKKSQYNIWLILYCQFFNILRTCLPHDEKMNWFKRPVLPNSHTTYNKLVDFSVKSCYWIFPLAKMKQVYTKLLF